MESKRTNIGLAIFYLLVGIVLFDVVPKFNATYSKMYDNWQSDQYILIQAYHLPNHLWLILFSLLSFIIFLSGSYSQGKYLKRVNISSFVILILLIIHIIDWLQGFIFCHSWGCSHYLPTWWLFS